MTTDPIEGIQLQEESVDFKVLVFKFAQNWYLFVLTVFVAIVVAFLFNNYTAPVYEVDTTLLIKSDQSAADPSRVIGLGMFNQTKSIENEIVRLKSFSHVFQVVQQLDFEVSYFEDRGMIRRELYHEAPFNVIYDSTVPQAVGLTYTVTLLNKNEYLLEAEGEYVRLYDYMQAKYVSTKAEAFKINETYKFGEEINTPYNTFKLVLNDRFRANKHITRNYDIIFRDYFSLTGALRGFTISPISEGASILNIKMRSKNARKATSYLNTLTAYYLKQSLEKKNQIVENTIRFIDDQLRVIADTVFSAAEDLQNFQTANKVMNIDFETEQILQQTVELEREKAQLIVTRSYYKNLENYVRSNLDQPESLIAPSSMGIEDPVLGSLFGALLSLYGERMDALVSATDNSPTLKVIDTKISATKQAILENIKNNQANIEETMNKIDEGIAQFDFEASKLPVTQYQLFGYQSRFDLANSLYTFLLKKRSEAQITKACLLYTSPSPRDRTRSRMPSSA